MTLKKELITEQGVCVEGGTVTLELKDEALEWRFFRPDGLFDSMAYLSKP